MEKMEPLDVALLVVDVFDKNGVLYFTGGSLASSIHGFARATRDVDIIADLKDDHIKPVYDELKSAFYIDDEAIKDAVRRQTSFNIIHLKSMFKIDVFILKQDRFSSEEFKRRKKITVLQSTNRMLFVATPEDTIISKLAWFRKGGESSDTQWRDILGVLKVQSNILDKAYLQYWAKELNLQELLAKALGEQY